MTFSRPLLLSTLLLAAAGSVLPADAQTEHPQQEGRKARRLETVTWNPIEHKLTWTVIDGALADKGKFEGSKKTTFSIDMDEATMSLEGEGRRFSKMEATSVHRLMDMVAKYAAESTLWWEAGEGERLPNDPSGNSRVDQRNKEKNRHDSLIPDTPRPRNRDRRDDKVLRIRVESVETIAPAKQLE